jgi:hypothetical protein
MKTYRFKIIERHFPFLGEFVATNRPQSVEIKKAGVELLDRVGWTNKYYSSLADFVEYQIYFVFDGQTLHEVPASGIYANGSGFRDEWEGVSVGEFCFENDLRPEIVIALNRSENDSCGNGTPYVSMTIYQLQNIDWDDYFAEKLNQAEKELGLG